MSSGYSKDRPPSDAPAAPVPIAPVPPLAIVPDLEPCELTDRADPEPVEPSEG